MEQHRRELLVARIVSGSLRCRLPDRKPMLLKKPSREHRYAAEEVYQDVLHEGELDGLFTEVELNEYLLENGLWDDEREKQLKEITKNIEELKVGLFRMTFQAKQRAITRQALAVTKATQKKLYEERHFYDYLSCAGAAAMARQRFLAGASLCWVDGSPVFTDESFWQEDTGILDDVLGWAINNRIHDEEFRELVRNEPWRSLWSCRRADGSFLGISSCDYTDEQRAAVCWSSLYDNVYEHPECPPDDVVADDDMLDGWLIIQRRQKEDHQTKKSGEELITNEKIRDSSEIFLVADTVDDARRINSLNDPYGQAIKKQRFNHLKKHGEVNEADMPNTRQQIRMDITKRFTQSMANRK